MEHERGDGESARRPRRRDLRRPREYTLYARRADRRCHGYKLKSDPELNGGEEFVDCIGDCSDGTGYCYATEAADGELLCAPCLLWKSFPSEQEGEVSCFDFGTPQGGPLPGTKDWADEGSCNAAAWSEAVASFNSTEEDGVAVPPARCLNSPNAAWNTDGGAERLIAGGRVATQRLHLDPDEPFTDFELRSGFHAARLGCLQTGAPGVVVPTHDVGLLSTSCSSRRSTSGVRAARRRRSGRGRAGCLILRASRSPNYLA